MKPLTVRAVVIKGTGSKASSLSERKCYGELQGYETRPESTICPEKLHERIRERPGA